GAEVEQGRLAVEAVSAVEVRPERATQLTAVDAADLPKQLVLRTSRPVLLAYRYRRAEAPPLLALALSGHRLAATQEATVDRAAYRTLITREGLQVTTAELMVRNTGKQFLKLALP